MGTLKAGKKKVEIFAESENENISNKVAQYPVQNGQPVVDHTQRESKTWEFTGKIFGKNQSDIDKKYQQLISWQYHGDLLTYRGAIKHSNIIIETLEKTYEDGGMKNALTVTINLRHVRKVKSSFKKKQKPATPPKKKKKGTYVTVKAGNTYWGWMMKYGTSINQLRKWNKWPDRRIPIGARARVK
jgi:LysM repeat protein